MEKTIATLKEGAALGAGAIVGAKWLDRNVFFKQKIASDPNFVNGMVYQHWGAIVAVGAAWGSTKVNNPWLKLVLVGTAVYGVLTEARQDFGTDDETHLPRWGMMGMGQDESAAKLDAALKQAAESPTSGNLTSIPVSGITDNYHSAVGSITDRYSSAVGVPSRIPVGW